MRYIKKNKLTSFVILIFILVVILASYIYNTFFGSGRSEAYGDRLDGIEAVEITKEQYDSVKEKLKENERVTKVTTNLKGKIVNIIMTVKDDVNKTDAKKIAEGALKIFEKEQLEFYDIQIFVKKENVELNDFPIVGYKQNGREGLTWSKDRQVTKDEEK